jgi:hypothetical protein
MLGKRTTGILVPQLGQFTQQKRTLVCNVAETLPAGLRWMADKKRREASRARHDAKDGYH